MSESTKRIREDREFHLGIDRRELKSHLRCSFAPDFYNNCYQRLLQDGLAMHHVEVDIRDTIHEITSDCISGRAKLDIVHLHWLPAVKRSPRSVLGALKLILNLRKLKANGVGLVWTAHNLIPHESVLPAGDLMLTSIVARMVDRIIVHTEAAGKELEQNCGVRLGPKLRMIPHGNYLGVYPEKDSGISARDQLGLAANDFVFLFVGAIRPYKGVPEMIEAFKEAKLDAKLVVAGKTSDKEFERRLKEEETRTPGFKFLSGFVADEDIPILHQAADIVVFSHQRALTSGALVLAMSFGKACLVPMLETLTEMVGTEGGIRYHRTDRGGMADGMRNAFSKRSGLKEMGDRNLEKAREWDWRYVARRTRDVYEEAMLNGNPKRNS